MGNQTEETEYIEKFLMRTEGGGPLDGNRIVNAEEYLANGVDPMSWPLPNQLDVPDGTGRYIKYSESTIEEAAPPDANWMRGAVYTWVPHEPPAEA